MSCRQQYRYLWLKEGDRTQYFQRFANSHMRNNQLNKLKVADEIIEDKDRMENEILDFY